MVALVPLGWLGIRAAREAHATQARAAAVCPRPVVGASSAASSRSALAATGHVFASHGTSGMHVSIIDLATGKVTRLPAGISDPHEVAVSPDGRWGVAADFGDYKGDYKFDGHRLAVFDLAAKRLARVIELGAYLGPHEIVFHPTSPNRAFVTTQTTRHVVEVDVEAGRVLGATETRAVGSHTMAVTGDGRTGFTANEPEATVSRLDFVRRAFVAKYEVGTGQTEGIGVTPDGREVWVAFVKEGVVRVVDGNTGAVLATIEGFMSPVRLALSPDGSRAVISDSGCKVAQVADVRTRRVLGPIAGLEGNIGAARVLPDNRTAVIAVLPEGIVAMVDLEERRVISRFDLDGWVDAVGWGPGLAGRSR
jgi:DNA-binding beta-propeller fold protein YncE